MSGRVEYDVIVVGAGAAGCALAYRLAESGTRRVLLLEAGADYASVDEHPDVLRTGFGFSGRQPDSPYVWRYASLLTAAVETSTIRGRAVGGSTAVNGGQFTRGTPDDYDLWAELGNDAWSYSRVLPYFRRLERDLDLPAEAWHGDNGPVPVCRPRPEAWTGVSAAFVDAALGLGHPWDADLNSPGSIGVGALPHNVVDGVRWNAGMCYLSPERPPNLEVVQGATVAKVVIQGQAVRGVEVRGAGGPGSYAGDEVVLSAGALNSPHLLMLSGIGPPEVLRGLGIPVVVESPGVGRGLMDHPAVLVRYTVDRQVSHRPDQPPAQVCLNYSSGVGPSTDDLRLFPYAYATPSSELALYCGVDIMDGRGELRLVSADPAALPVISHGYMTNAEDLARMRHGVRLACDVLRQPAFAHLDPSVCEPGAAILDSDRALDEWIVANMSTAFHTAGSCRMGPPGDPGAVVDQLCRVYGVDGLRVVDASVMPRLVRRGPSATASMIGERAAALMT